MPGGEANLKLPDPSWPPFSALMGNKILMFGLIFCVFAGFLFGNL